MKEGQYYLQMPTTFTDLYGRGYSEAPDLPSDANLFGLQLALLLQYIGWESTDIVGFSIVRMASLNAGRMLTDNGRAARRPRYLLHYSHTWSDEMWCSCRRRV